MSNAFRNEEILSSIKWYFEAKNLSLKNALSLQPPLSAESQRDIRLYYSQYFAYLLSATELLLEDEYPHNVVFKKALADSFSFPDFPDGTENYNYLRELRNSIIHRGHDITSSAHADKDRLLYIAPENITNRNGKKVHRAYGFYILEIITKTEEIIGSLFWSHIESVGLLKPSIHHSKILGHAISFIASIRPGVMPEWAKEMALQVLPTIDFETIQNSQFKELKSVLLSNDLTSVGFTPACKAGAPRC